MTNEVATKEAFKPPLVTGGRVKAIVPENIEQAFRLATAIAAANMAPKAYNRDANSIMIGIMHGMEVGFTPMAALQSIAVINGMPVIWGDGALALVRASGLLEEVKETTTGEGDQAKANCWVKRKGEEGMERSFSVADAKKAELWGKKGPWQTYPQRMLLMRARSWALRDGFADVLRGLHIAEEAQDMGNLYQAADGTYVPAEKPLREHYLKEAEARQQAAEPDLDAAHRRVTTGYSGDEPEESENEETDKPSEDATGDEGPGGGEGTPNDPPAGSPNGDGQAKPASKGLTAALSNLKAGLGKQGTLDDLDGWLARPMVGKTAAGLSPDEQAAWHEAVENTREALGQME